MFDEPNESPAERAFDPLVQAREKFDEFRMHAELAAVFEGHRKFDAQIYPNLDANLAREIQRTIGRLEKSRSPEHPLLPPQSVEDARALLKLSETRELSTNDYHIHRRPGEVMIVRFLAADEVEAFYERFQAHFDAALNAYREEERQANAWRQDEKTLAYLDALDKIEVKMADRYLRDTIKTHRVFILSTQSADEIDIGHLADYLMAASPVEIVGEHSAPPEDGATERDRAWFFKLFSLRGIVESVERMCFFAYLQKTDESLGD
jgi:hypothetical protein